MARYDINIQDYGRILKKRRALIVSATLLFAAVSVFAGILRAPEALYESASAVKVERATDLTTLLLGTVSWTNWDNVATQSVIITSFPIMERAARAMGRLPADVTSEEVMHNAKYSAVVSGLRGQLTVEQEKNTNIINISATASNPREAQSIANTVARVYQEANSDERNRKILETKDFIEKQLKSQEQRLQDAEERLKRFKQETELVAIDTQTQTMLAQLTMLETEADQLRQKRFDLQSQMEQIQKQESPTRASPEVTSAEKGTSFLGMLNNRILELKLRREILLNDFTEDHPEVKAVESELKGIVVTMTKELQASVGDLDHRLTSLEKQIKDLRFKLSNTPDDARRLERLQRDVAVNAKLEEDLKTKYQEALIQEAGKIQEVTIVKPALESRAPINQPMHLVNAFSGGLIGLVIGVVLALFMESLDTSITGIEEIEEFLKVPVLGVIPGKVEAPADKAPEGGDDQQSLIVYFAPDSPAAEAYRSLVSHFQSSRLETSSKVLLMTSSSGREGKSYNAVNLALSLAQTGDRVLLVDANLRNPVLHKIFGIDRELGLTDYLWGNCELKDCTKTIIDIMAGELEMGDLLRAPGLDYLHIVTAGAVPMNPWGVLRSPRLKEMMEQAKASYDTIIIDTPAVLGAADTCDIASGTNGVVLVYETGRINRAILLRAKEQLESVHATLRGVILNNVRPETAQLSQQALALTYSDAQKSLKGAYEGMSSFGQKLAAFANTVFKRNSQPSVTVSKPRATRTGHKFFAFLIVLAIIVIILGLVWQNFPGARQAFRLFMR